MVDLKGVRHSNQSLAALQPSIVAVFAGATAGIGLGTLTQFTKHTNAPVVFIVGRSEEKGREIVDRLKNINPKGTFHFIQAQFSLLREVDRVSVEIKKLTTHVDILYLSTGYLTFEGRKETIEGIESDFALQYYARMRLIINLLPLLDLSSSPRVISIFCAGREGPLPSSLSEIDNAPGNFAPYPASTMMTLIFEYFASQHPKIVFVHTFPGLVDTKIFGQLFEGAPGVLWYLALIPRYMLLPIARRTLFRSPDEAGERVLFLATSKRYSPAGDEGRNDRGAGWVESPKGVGVARATVVKEGRGNGVYRIEPNDEACPESALLEGYRKEGKGKLIYEHALKVFGKALEMKE